MSYKDWVSKFPIIGKYIVKYPPGHYYSPIPSKKDIISRSKSIYGSKEVLDIDLKMSSQFMFLEDCKTGNKKFDSIGNLSKSGNRYSLNNGYFDYTDAVFLYNIMLHFKPKKYFEVGCGFSTALAVDTDEMSLGDSIEYLLIEPYPKRLKDLIKEEDFQSKKIELVEDIVQNVDPIRFQALESKDILFTDSTHISKLGSDVNYLFFEVLPLLKSGVLIHIHDIFFPFEYSKTHFLQESFSFNELYLLRAFLMNNNDYEVICWPNYLFHKNSSWFQQNAPKIYEHEMDDEEGTGSIWLRKK